MKVILEKINTSPENFLKLCGYVQIENPHKNGEISYARSLDPGRFYPRFHIYLNQLINKLDINIHLDMKKPSYEGATAHSGEYDGELVQNEVLRIQKISTHFIGKELPKGPIGFAKKKSLWQKIFGK